MPSSPILFVHICGATLGLLSGFMAILVRKGSGWHGAAGNIFVASMLGMTTSAAYVASFMRPNMLNLTAASLTFYLVITGWWTVRRRDGGAGMFERAALLFAIGVGLAGVGLGLEGFSSPNGGRNGMPAGMYLAFGTIALLFAVADVRMLVRGGVAGTQRIVRHLWRMSLALLITTLSFYPGQAKLFPKSWRATSLPYMPHVLLIGLMIFWLVRMSGRKRAQRNAMVAATRGDVRRETSRPLAA
jgi:uncharacterized membrane protein